MKRYKERMALYYWMLNYNKIKISKWFIPKKTFETEIFTTRKMSNVWIVQKSWKCVNIFLSFIRRTVDLSHAFFSHWNVWNIAISVYEFTDTRNIFQEICFLADSHKPNQLHTKRHHQLKHTKTKIALLKLFCLCVCKRDNKKRNLISYQQQTMNEWYFRSNSHPFLKFRSDNKWTNNTNNNNIISISIVLIIF